MNLFRTKSIEVLKQHAEKNALRRSLGALDLTLLGVGVFVGAGIFVLRGHAAA